jgi:hypothetical protein
LLAPKKAASRAATASSPCVATVVIQARFNTTVPLALVKQLREKTKAGYGCFFVGVDSLFFAADLQTRRAHTQNWT